MGGLPQLEVQFFYEYAVVVLVLTGGVFLCLIIAELISGYGIGNGVSIILLTGICAGYGHNITKTGRYIEQMGFSLHPFLIISILVLLTVILLRTQISMSVRQRLLREPLSFFQLNTCPSGNVAIGYATSLILPSLTVSHFFDGGDYLARILVPRGLIYHALLVTFIFVFSYLFAYLFFHPKRRFKRMPERGWQIKEGDHNALKELSRKVFIYNFPWTVFLCVLAIIPHILITRFNSPLYIGGSTLILLVAISIDVWDRLNVLRKTRSEELCKIAELHDVYDASMMRRHMESEGILCHFQGYHHRHLLYFLGPYIDISVKVAERDRKSAEELIRKYYDGLGLL